MRYSMLAALGVLSATLTFAAEASHTERITSLLLGGDGSVEFGVLEAPARCNGKFRLALGRNVTSEGLKSILAASMTAYALQSPVEFRYELVGTDCLVNSILLAKQ